MKSRSRSHTSNNVKLYKHLDKLQLLQTGTISPIMIHMSPTHKCQMNCVFCCFKNRKDKALDMPLNVLKEGVKQFYALGTKAIEFTGGGEPTLYPYVNEALDWLSWLEMHIGINTNAIDSQLIERWELFDWARISLNMFDYHDSINIELIKKSGVYISGCYIWNELSTPDTLERVVQFANKEKIACRIAPDCIIKSLKELDKTIEDIRRVIKRSSESDYIFLSDFNIDTSRHNQKCYIHMIKPCFNTDGYVYPCPSIELAFEHDAQIPEEFRLCRYDEIEDFYRCGKAFEILEQTCSYCKYAKQQIVLEDVLTKTDFNEFA